MVAVAPNTKSECKQEKCAMESTRYISFILSTFSFAIAREKKAEKQISYELSSHMQLRRGKDLS